MNKSQTEERKRPMKKNLERQTAMWDWLYGVFLYEAPSIYKQCATPRTIEYEELYEKMGERFCSTLNEEQQEAFSHFMEIVDSVRWNAQEMGFAIGLQTAKEMRKFLDLPAETYKEYVSTLTPMREMEEHHIKGLEEYFKKHED